MNSKDCEECQGCMSIYDGEFPMWCNVWFKDPRSNPKRWPCKDKRIPRPELTEIPKKFRTEIPKKFRMDIEARIHEAEIERDGCLEIAASHRDTGEISLSKYWMQFAKSEDEAIGRLKKLLEQ